MKKLISFLICTMAVLAGCAHDLSLIPRQGGARGQGVANEMGKTVTINLNGKIYSGKYVYDGGGVAYSSTYGTSRAQKLPPLMVVALGQHIYPVQEMVGFSPLLQMVTQYAVNFSIQVEVVLVYAKTMQEMNTTY